MTEIDQRWEQQAAAFIGNELARPLRLVRAHVLRPRSLRLVLFLLALSVSTALLIATLPISLMLMAITVIRGLFQW